MGTGNWELGTGIQELGNGELKENSGDQPNVLCAWTICLCEKPSAMVI